jgi:hypothetical protein
MNRYDKTELLKLLDSATISAILRIYGITYKHLAIKLNCTRPNVSYHIKHDSFKGFEREVILDLFFQHGLEVVELMLINNMVKTAKKFNKEGGNK